MILPHVSCANFWQQVLGQLYVSGTIIPWRTSRFRAFVHGRRSQPPEIETKLQARLLPRQGKRPEFRSSPSGGAPPAVSWPRPERLAVFSRFRK